MPSPLENWYNRVTHKYFGITITHWLRKFRSPLYWFTVALFFTMLFAVDDKLLVMKLSGFYFIGLLMGHLWW